MNFDAEEEESRINFRINSWDLNNEFNTKRGLKCRRNDKEHHIYGNFMDSESEDETERERPDLDESKDIKFVLGGLKEGSDSARLPEKVWDEEEDMDQTMAFNKSNRGLKFESKGKHKKFDQQFAGMRNVGPIGTDEEFGRWESYTKGIGAKLLGKMGYEVGKGLGKNLQGITAPIVAKKRPGFGAIGCYGPEHKHKPMNTEEEADERLKTRQKLKAEHNWRKTERNTKRAKTVIKSADQIIAENLLKPWNESEISKTKVIDMTGPEQRVFSGYHQISQQKVFEDSNSSEAFNVPEEDNIDVLVDISEQEIVENGKELIRESQRYNSLEKEIERIEKVVEEETKQCVCIEIIFDRIECLSKKLKENELSIEEVLKKYDEIKNEFPFEFDSLKLHEILIPTAFPLFRHLLLEWKPLVNCDSLKQLFKHFKRITSDTEDAIYDHLMWEIWMPVVRRDICDWPSIRQCDEVIAFLESWRLLVPEWLFDNIVEQIVLPLLQKEVDEWNPLTDTVPIHSWLHPWLPLMVDRSLEHLYDPIRQKLANALTSWHPSDGSAKLILQPWKGVFSSGAMEAFLNINIVPKLEIALQSLVINPHQQCLDVWHWVMSWQDLLSTQVMAAILEKNFFPRWLTVLYNWLSNGPNYTEIEKWYLGWKSMLAPQLESHPSIKDATNRALHMMNHSSNSSLGLKSSYFPIRSQQQMSSNSFVSAKDDSIPDVCLNFRQLVERKAEERGILFMPIPNRLYQGKQVFKFGTLLIHIDRQVLFTFNNNNWIPISLQSLIDSAI